jgi:Mg2+/Co2+ transporter CorB
MLDPTMAALAFGATLALLACSAFFSSTETAIFSLQPTWVAEQAASGDSRAAAHLRDLTADPHRLLVTLLVGNNVVNVAISSIVAVVVASVLPPGQAVVVTTLVTSATLLVFGEIVPKSFGLGHAETWSLRVAGTVRLVERALAPLIWLFDGLTRRLTSVVDGETAIETPYTE